MMRRANHLATCPAAGELPRRPTCRHAAAPPGRSTYPHSTCTCKAETVCQLHALPEAPPSRSFRLSTENNSPVRRAGGGAAGTTAGAREGVRAGAALTQPHACCHLQTRMQEVHNLYSSCSCQPKGIDPQLPSRRMRCCRSLPSSRTTTAQPQRLTGCTRTACKQRGLQHTRSRGAGQPNDAAAERASHMH